MTPILEVRQLLVRRGERVVLEVDHLAVQPGEVLAVIGPNGSGKSTLVLALSQLLRVERGTFLFRGQPLDRDVLAFRRKIGLVLQDPLLLDTSVYANVATGLRFRGLPEKTIRPVVEEWLAKLGIEKLAGRRSRALSGGEAQRVSLARAFALNPDILFLDEPFSSLDTPTRQRLLADFQELVAASGVTTLIVTHDMDEALLLGSRVAVLIGGRVRQDGLPDQVFNSPVDPDVAEFVGVETVLAGKVLRMVDGVLSIDVHGSELQAVGNLAPGRDVLFCLRPEDVTISLERMPYSSSARNHLSGTIQRILPQGPLARIVLDCGFPLIALVTRASVSEMALVEGQQANAAFKASAVHLIPR
jgi:tungstate transport system ATP-binding protein